MYTQHLITPKKNLCYSVLRAKQHSQCQGEDPPPQQAPHLPPRHRPRSLHRRGVFARCGENNFKHHGWDTLYIFTG